MDEIKQIAEEALRVQNKDMMDAALRQIVKICERPKEAGDVLPRRQFPAGGMARTQLASDGDGKAMK